MNTLGKSIMEPDRFQQNQTHYIVGIMCLITSLSLFAFCVYLLPYLIFHWHYSMPDFILSWANQLHIEYGFSTFLTSSIIFVGLFLPAVILAIIADVFSNQIDNEIHGIKTQKVKVKREMKESSSLSLRIILIVILVFIAAELFQWIISSEPP